MDATMALTAGAALLGGADWPPPHPAHTPAATKTRAAISGRIQFVAGSVAASPALSERSSMNSERESKGLAISCLTGQWIGHSDDRERIRGKSAHSALFFDEICTADDGRADSSCNRPIGCRIGRAQPAWGATPS